MAVDAADRLRDVRVCRKALDFVSLVSNTTRLRILCALSHGEFRVSEIAAQVGGKESNVSQQLKILALGGAVAKERRAKAVSYRIVDARIRRLLVFLRREFG